MIQILIALSDDGAMEVKRQNCNPIVAIGILELAKLQLERGMREPPKQTPDILLARGTLPPINGN